MHSLSMNPKWQQALQKECDQLPEDPSYEDFVVKNTPVSYAIVKETLRLFPIATQLIRQAIEPCEVAGIKIPSGVRLIKC
jgi:cytochrome P450